MPHILIVDDEQALVWVVAKDLNFHGYTTSNSYDGVDALRKLEVTTPDLILLDIRLPQVDGYEVCRRLRADARLGRVPIIFMTACGDLNDKLCAYATGADDYMVKPFDMRELIVRVQAVLRRTRYSGPVETLLPESDALQVGDLCLTMCMATVHTPQGDVQLTPNELELLSFFMHHPSRIFCCDDLLRDVWHYPARAGDPALVRWHVRNLRRKIEPCPEHPRYLRTIPHHGYVLETVASGIPV